MIIWIVTVGEPLPIDDPNIRLHRSGLLAESFASDGHEVHWITSNFDHTKKKIRTEPNDRINISGLFTIHLLHTLTYKKNISLRRMISNLMIAIKFVFKLRGMVKPDRIVVSYPTIELSFIATLFGKIKKIPVIVDVRDLWPDIFLRITDSKYIKGVLRILLSPYFFMQGYVFRNATSLVSISHSMLTWAQERTHRIPSDNDGFFYFGYRSRFNNVSDPFWNDVELARSEGKLILCFFGNIALPTCQLDHYLAVKNVDPMLFSKLYFVFCGSGESLEYFKKMYIGCSNVKFPGFQNAERISSLMALADIGLLPYKSTFDFELSIPNKVIEYLSGGLPILSSLEGEVDMLLSNNHFGMTYRSKDDLINCLKLLCNDRNHFDVSSIDSYFRDNFDSSYVYKSYVNFVCQQRS